MHDRTRQSFDPNQLAKCVVDAATHSNDAVSGSPPQPPPVKKNRAAVSLGRRGGKKGGPARALKLTAERKSEIARNAAAARWGKAQEN